MGDYSVQEAADRRWRRFWKLYQKELKELRAEIEAMSKRLDELAERKGEEGHV